MGMNLPAHTVIIRDTKRYDSEYGSGYLPVLEVQQMMGRAGRPKYDTEGRAIIVAKSKAEAKELKEEGKKDNKIFKYAVVFVVLALIVFFGYSFRNFRREMAPIFRQRLMLNPMFERSLYALHLAKHCLVFLPFHCVPAYNNNRHFVAATFSF